jgi:hypothetical protein
MLNFDNSVISLSEEDLKDIRVLNIIDYNKLIIERAMSGYYGFKRLVNPASNITPDSGYKFCVVYAVEDSNITVTGNSSVASQVLNKGQMLAGRFTEVSCTAGSYVMAYQIPSGA